MKVGDLVELSAAGNKLQFLAHLKNKHGIVLDVLPRLGYTVQWFGITKYSWRNGRQGHYRRELKFLKKRSRS